VNDVDRWIYFDGPEPACVRPLLDALRDRPPPTPQDRETASRRFFATLDGAVERGDDRVSGEVLREQAERRVVEGESTERSPVRVPEVDERRVEPSAPAVVDRGGGAAVPGVRAPASVKSTAPLLDLPAEVREQLARLPFKPEAPGQAPKVKTLQAAVMPRKGHGETAPIGDESIVKARAVLPFARSLAAAAVVPVAAFPELTLQQYASLRSELAVWPDRSGEILGRYGVRDEAARAALDEHWGRRMAGESEVRAAFVRLLTDFTVWLRSRG
jgi:hypothetical protein